MKSLDRLLGRPVPLGNPFVLSQVLDPGFHEERFQHASLFGSIFKNAPRIGTVTATLLAELFDRREKRLTITRIDSVFDRHQDGPAIVVELMESNRRWPMHRWRQIDFSAGLQFPRPCQRDRSECASGGGRDCLQKVFPKWSIPWETSSWGFSSDWLHAVFQMPELARRGAHNLPPIAGGVPLDEATPAQLAFLLAIAAKNQGARAMTWDEQRKPQFELFMPSRAHN